MTQTTAPSRAVEGPGSSPYLETFSARFPVGTRGSCLRQWAQRFSISCDTAWGLYVFLAGEYCRGVAVAGWTPNRLMTLMIHYFRHRPRGSRTLAKFKGMLQSSGLIVLQRSTPGSRGKISRVWLPGVIEHNGTPENWQQRHEEKKAQARDRKRRSRENIKRKSLQTDSELIAQEVDLLEAHDWKTPLSRLQDNAEVEDFGDGHKLEVLSHAKRQEKQIPLPPHVGDEEKLEEAQRKPREKPSPEHLQSRLMYFGTRASPLSGPEFRAELGDEIYRSFVGHHPHGLQGMKATWTTEQFLAVSRKVAGQYGSKATTSAQRCERYRKKVDRRRRSATCQEMKQAAETAFGPASDHLNPQRLAWTGVPLEVAEVVFERVIRQAKVGSDGSLGLRTPKAFSGYVMKALRNEALRR